MRVLRLLPLLALTGLVLVAAPAAAATSTAAAPAAAAQDGGEATIVDFDFSPRRLTVAAGTKVTWSNTGQRPHTATDRGGAFDTKPIAPGATAEVTLSSPGT
jgi:plastocyanin